MEELIDEVDRNGNVIATHPRSHLKERLFLHKVSLIIPMAADNRIILCRRAKDKHPFPGVWVCGVGGGAKSGESEEEAALREMKEEIGKTYPLRKVASFLDDREEYKAFFTIFTTMVPVSIKDLKVDPREIQYLKEFTIEEAIALATANPDECAPTFIVAIKEFAEHYR